MQKSFGLCELLNNSNQLITLGSCHSNFMNILFWVCHSHCHLHMYQSVLLPHHWLENFSAVLNFYRKLLRLWILRHSFLRKVKNIYWKQCNHIIESIGSGGVLTLGMSAFFDSPAVGFSVHLLMISERSKCLPMESSLLGDRHFMSK